MALDDLPGTLEVPTRGDIAAQYRRDYGLVSPESDTSDGTQPDVQAKTLAITLLPVYSDAVLIANAINEDAALGKRLDRVGARCGVPRPQPRGSSGYVSVAAAAGGGTIQLGDELKNAKTNKRYQAAETLFVNNGDKIRVAGKDTGPSTNLNGGILLQWSQPRPGIGQNAIVVPDDALNPTGPGLIGGAELADDASYLLVIQEARRNPPNADNDAAIQQIVRATPDVAIQAVFSYPCVFGPGTYAYAFTLATPAGADPQNRIPTGAQITSTLAYMTGQLPADDSYFAVAIVKQATAPALQVTWDPAAIGWADAVPWPAYQSFGQPAGTAGTVLVTAQNDATHFTLGTDNGDYTNAVQPQVGQTIGFWDTSGGLAFRKKRISAISGTGPWIITTDTIISDQVYSPIFGQRVCPWSDSLADLVKPILAYFAMLGPGEMFTEVAMSNDGRRQRRNPRPPKKYPQAIGNDVLVPIFALPSIQTTSLREGLGVTPTIGTPGVSVFLLTLGDLSAFP